jgi:hypothetical protein
MFTPSRPPCVIGKNNPLKLSIHPPLPHSHGIITFPRHVNFPIFYPALISPILILTSIIALCDRVVSQKVLKAILSCLEKVTWPTVICRRVEFPELPIGSPVAIYTSVTGEISDHEKSILDHVENTMDDMLF